MLEGMGISAESKHTEGIWGKETDRDMWLTKAKHARTTGPQTPYIHGLPTSSLLNINLNIEAPTLKPPLLNLKFQTAIL